MTENFLAFLDANIVSMATYDLGTAAQLVLDTFFFFKGRDEDSWMSALLTTVVLEEFLSGCAAKKSVTEELFPMGVAAMIPVLFWVMHNRRSAVITLMGYAEVLIGEGLYSRFPLPLGPVQALLN